MSAQKVAVGAIRAVKKATRTKIPQRQALSLTSAAVNRIKELLLQKPNMAGLKVGVKQRGCNGLTYTLDYVGRPGKFDEVVDQDGAKVFVDAKAQLTLLGTEMDYVEDKLTAEFVFHNPNIKGTCGCGESFNM